MVFFERNQNERAESAFAAALAEPTGAPGGPAAAELRCQAEFHRAQSIFKQRQRSRAAPAFLLAETACKQAGNVDLLTKSLYQGARCLASAGERDTALQRYASIEREAAAHSYADDARLRAAEIFTDRRRSWTRRRPCWPTCPIDTPTATCWARPCGGWRWPPSARARWVEAHRWLDENLRRVPREEIWYAEGRALYWKARVFTRQGDSKQALGFYQRAVREYPLSVYALLAFERLRTESPATRRGPPEGTARSAVGEPDHRDVRPPRGLRHGGLSPGGGAGPPGPGQRRPSGAVAHRLSGAGQPRRRPRDARPSGKSSRTCTSSPRCCWTAGGAGARPTPSPVTR